MNTNTQHHQDGAAAGDGHARAGGASRPDARELAESLIRSHALAVEHLTILEVLPDGTPDADALADEIHALIERAEVAVKLPPAAPGTRIERIAADTVRALTAPVGAGPVDGWTAIGLCYPNGDLTRPLLVIRNAEWQYFSTPDFERHDDVPVMFFPLKATVQVGTSISYEFVGVSDAT